MLGCGKWRLGYMGLVDDIRYGNETTDIEGGGVCVRLWGLGADIVVGFGEDYVRLLVCYICGIYAMGLVHV